MKKHISLLALPVLFIPLMVGCPSKPTFCLHVINNKAENFAINIEDCKTKEIVSVSSIDFSRGEQLEPIWVIFSDNIEQREGRPISTLTYGKVPEYFQAKRDPRKLMKGDRLSIHASGPYGSVQEGFLQVTVEPD
jgi:hypothetical protein